MPKDFLLFFLPDLDSFMFLPSEIKPFKAFETYATKFVTISQKVTFDSFNVKGQK